MRSAADHTPPSRVSARLRLALSYAAFLVVAGGVTLVGVYIVLRYVPDYPLTAANPRDTGSDGVASRQEILNALVGISGIVLAALAAIGITGGWFLAGWILRPLQRISEAASLAATGRLDHRIGLTGRNDEFRQLADTFDRMLERLHDAFITQERFAANASHELRTPLAVTSTLLDVARSNPGEQDYPELLERLSVTNARAIGLTEALLRLADANAITAVSESLDLARIVQTAIAEHTEEAELHRVIIGEKLGVAPITGDAELLSQLVSNLVQNVIRHNHVPGNADITTHHEPTTGTVVLRVEGGGEDYSAEAAAQLSEPFLRGAGRVRSSEPRSYGLGLALVSRITAVHGGTLDITPRNGGGLVVVVTLPDRTTP